MFAIATNACAHDSEIISHTVPSWLRVFGGRLAQVHIVVDERPPSGRIASNRAHDRASPEVLQEVLDRFARLDARVQVSTLSKLPHEQYLHAWFTNGLPDRCQAGTPILPFVAAFEVPDAEFVLRADCDMLFSEGGWLAEAMRLLETEEADLVEPPRLGTATENAEARVTTRALMIRPAAFHNRCLPIPAHRLDALRRAHRRLQGRPPWLALEQMLEIERKRGRIRYRVLDRAFGFWLHVDQRSFPSRERVEDVVGRVESGNVPLAQRDFGWNFSMEAWLDRA